MSDAHDTYKTLDLALRVGEMLLSSGAGAADVTATMLSVTHALGLRGVSADVTFTQVSLVDHPAGEAASTVQVRHVKHREIDYEDLTLVDHLVGDLVSGRLDRDEALARMKRLTSTGHRRPRWAVTLGWGVMGAGVAVLLGGGLVVSCLAFVAACLLDRIQRYLTVRRFPVFYQQVAGGAVATLLAIGASAMDMDVRPSHVITAGIVMLLAGIGFMGAVQDALTGFPLTAAARMLEAVLATAGIIAGVSLGLTTGDVLGFDLGRINPGTIGSVDPSVMALGASISAAAFAFSSYAPLRALLPVAAVAAVGTAVYAAAANEEVGRAWASALAAVLIGVVSYSVAGRVRVPPLVVVVPAIVPLLPGLTIFRGLTALAEDGNGMIHLASAAATAIALAAGVILGQYLAQPLKREARRLETRLSGPRLVGPLRVRAVRRPERRVKAQVPRQPRFQRWPATSSTASNSVSSRTSSSSSLG